MKKRVRVLSRGGGWEGRNGQRSQRRQKRDQQCWQQSYYEKQHRSAMLRPKDWPVVAWHDWLGLLDAECQDTRAVLRMFSKRVAPWSGGQPAAEGRTSTGAGCWQDRGRTPGKGTACCSISRWVGRKDSPCLGLHAGGRSLCMSEHVSGCSPDVPPPSVLQVCHTSKTDKTKPKVS